MFNVRLQSASWIAQKCAAFRGLKRRPLDVATKTGPWARVRVCPPRTMWPISGPVVSVGEWLGFTVKPSCKYLGQRKEVPYAPTRIVVRKPDGV